MPCTVVNSQAQTQARLPSLPQQLPSTQAQWTSFLQTLNAWAQILQQESHAPNVLPAQFQTFAANAAAPVLAALTAANCTPSIDATTQYYGAASLKVAIAAAGATLSFTGTPISIAGASRWFAAFQILAPGGCTGSLTVKTASATITEAFTVSADAAWQQVWGLFDLRAIADTQATWEFTFTSTATVWLDGLQMNLIGSPLSKLPKFAGSQMVAGALAYASSVDLATGQVLNKTANNISYTTGGTVDSLKPAQVGADVTGTHTSADTAAVNGTAAATVSQGASRANAAIDSTNIVVAGAIDLSRAYTNKSLANIPDDATSGRVAAVRFRGPAPGGAPAWYKLGTWNFTGNYGDTLKIEYLGGSGFNTGAAQQANATILVRSGDEVAAPNLSGVSWWESGGGNAAILAVKAVATGGSTSISNASWDVYVELDNYANGQVAITTSPGSTWTNSGALASDPGVASSTVVVGTGGQVMNAGGTGMDALREGGTYLRMPAPPGISASGGAALSNTGSATAITVGAGTFNIGNLTMNTSAGSVDPGAYGGPYYVYFDASAGYAGGAVTYKVTTNPADLSKSPWRFPCGSITTTSGTSGSGGGINLPPCFSGDTRIRTARGLERFDELPRYFELLNHTGRHRAELLVHPASLAACRLMGRNLVTDDHLLRVGSGWVKAKFLFSEKARVAARTLYNVHVFSDAPEDHHYILENGLTAHNAKP